MITASVKRTLVYALTDGKLYIYIRPQHFNRQQHKARSLNETFICIGHLRKNGCVLITCHTIKHTVISKGNWQEARFLVTREQHALFSEVGRQDASKVAKRALSMVTNEHWDSPELSVSWFSACGPRKTFRRATTWYYWNWVRFAKSTSDEKCIWLLS